MTTAMHDRTTYPRPVRRGAETMEALVHVEDATTPEDVGETRSAIDKRMGVPCSLRDAGVGLRGHAGRATVCGSGGHLSCFVLARKKRLGPRLVDRAEVDGGHHAAEHALGEEFAQRVRLRSRGRGDQL